MRKKTSGDDQTRDLLRQMLNEALVLPNWNQTALQSSLRGVDPLLAVWRPPHASHSIAEITVHCAYWKYTLRQSLLDGPRGEFPFKGNNWFAVPDPLSREQWNGYRNLLRDEHRALIEAVDTTRRSLRISARALGKRWTPVQRMYWLAIHDGYHTGQVNLIKAMYRRSRKK